MAEQKKRKPIVRKKLGTRCALCRQLIEALPRVGFGTVGTFDGVGTALCHAGQGPGRCMTLYEGIMGQVKQKYQKTKGLEPNSPEAEAEFEELREKTAQKHARAISMQGGRGAIAQPLTDVARKLKGLEEQVEKLEKRGELHHAKAVKKAMTELEKKLMAENARLMAEIRKRKS